MLTTLYHHFVLIVLSAVSNSVVHKEEPCQKHGSAGPKLVVHIATLPLKSSVLRSYPCRGCGQFLRESGDTFPVQAFSGYFTCSSTVQHGVCGHSTAFGSFPGTSLNKLCLLPPYWLDNILCSPPGVSWVDLSTAMKKASTGERIKIEDLRRRSVGVSRDADSDAAQSEQRFVSELMDITPSSSYEGETTRDGFAYNPPDPSVSDSPLARYESDAEAADEVVTGTQEGVGKADLIVKEDVPEVRVGVFVFLSCLFDPALACICPVDFLLFRLLETAVSARSRYLQLQLINPPDPLLSVCQFAVIRSSSMADTVLRSRNPERNQTSDSGRHTARVAACCWSRGCED